LLNALRFLTSFSIYVADFTVTEKMLTYFVQKAHSRKVLVHPRIVIGVPSSITQVEKRAVQDSAYRAKAS